MRIEGARTLIAGAGHLGADLADRLAQAGARVVVAGRDPALLSALGERLGTTPVALDVVDADAVSAAVDAAVAQLGGLDLLVSTVGVPGFGPAVDLDAAVAEELFAVNTLGPMSLVQAATPHLSGGAEAAMVVVYSAILAELPTARMAAYGASKAALAHWLEVLRREERRRFGVLDVRPPHLDTGLETRALAGEPPRLPAGLPAGRVTDAVLEAIVASAREVVWDAQAGALAVR